MNLYPPTRTEPPQQDGSDDNTVLDPTARGKIEQLVLEILEKMRLEESLMPSADDSTVENSVDDIGDTPICGTSEADGDADDTSLAAEDVGGVVDDTLAVSGVSILPLQEKIAAGLNAVVLDAAREALYRDGFILRAAKRYPPEVPQVNSEDGRLEVLSEDTIQFYLPAAEFLPWLKAHQATISTNYVHNDKYDYARSDCVRHSYYCQRAGKTTQRKDRVKGGKSGKPRIRKSDMKIGCRAAIFALTMKKRLANGLMEDTYHVEYRYQHNHTLGSLTDIGARQKSSIIKATIKSLIMQGSTIRSVMQKLAMDYDKFAQIVRGGGQKLTRDDFVTYNDVYNIWHEITTAAMRKDPDPTLSAIKWMEEFEASKGFTYYDRDDRTNGVYFGFSSLWQLEQLKAHGRVLCFDGTHNVFGHKTNLFTLVLKHRDTGTGIPVSFLLTKSCEAHIIVNWLQALRKTMKDVFSLPDQEYNYEPNTIITDQGNTEILAVKSVFPGVSLHYCAWRVLKVWEHEVSTRMHGLGAFPVARRVEIRSEAMTDLRAILYEKDKAKAIACIASFRAKWSGYGELILHLNKNYFGEDDKDNAQEKQRHWMVCYRQDVSYSCIDTNNYIESWHNTLNRHLFRDNQQRSVDTVIYVLAVIAVPHFQQKCIRSVVKVGRMDSAQRNELRLTNMAMEHLTTRLTRGYEGDCINQGSDTTLTVESFTRRGITYNVEVSFHKSHTGHIISCTCDYFQSHSTCCKHIALVSWSCLR